MNNPYGIAVFQNHLIWTEFRTPKINIAEIDSNGDLKETTRIFYEDNVPIFALAVYDEAALEKRLEKANDACSTKNGFGDCEQLCYPMYCGEKKECEKKLCGCAQGYSVRFI